MPRHSEIFDAYEKIAIESGLVSSDEELIRQAAEERKDSPAMKRYKKSPAPRAGSDDISTIEALYGVKCDNTVNYEHNIFENAHPNAVIIGPSYDRMNGLIENPNERQNFIINQIMNKTPNGNLTQHRYAKEELLMELIRVANDLDSRGNESLRKLADHCIELVVSEEKKSSELTKFALFPLLLAAAGVLAATWLWNHADDPNHGISNDISNCIQKLNALKENSWYESDVDATVQRDVNELETKLNLLDSELKSFGQVMLLLDNPQMPDTQIDMADLSNTAKVYGASVYQQTNRFVAAIDHFVPDLIIAINKFTSRNYQETHQNPSALSRFVGWVGEAVHGRWGLIANDFISAANALGALKTSLQNVRNKAANIDEVRQSFAKDLSAQTMSFKKEKPIEPINPSSRKPSPFGGGGQDQEEIEDDVSLADDEFVEAARALGFKPRGKR
jgi:hypothetical protein